MSRVGAWIAAVGIHAGVLLSGGGGEERLRADAPRDAVGPCEFFEIAEHVSLASARSIDVPLPADHPDIASVRKKTRMKRVEPTPSPVPSTPAADVAPSAPAADVAPSARRAPKVLDLTAHAGSPRFAVTAVSRTTGIDGGGSSGASARGPAASGEGGAGEGGGSDGKGARGIRVASRRWRCPWPASADRLAIHRERVEVRVCVDEHGALGELELRSDPGHGFGEAALACARKARFSPATDELGRPRAACAPLLLRFER